VKIPLPILRIVNPLVRLLLRSPIHGLMSRDVMLLTVTGRRTGRRYTMPVSYLRDGDRVRAFTDRGIAWWRNLRGGAEVTVVIAGEARHGHGEAVVDDATRIVAALGDFLTRLPRDAVYYEVALDTHGRPIVEDVRRAADDVALVEIILQTTPASSASRRS
jgi:hypothetical protein